MPEYHCLKDYCDSDLDELEEVADKMGWTEIKHDVRQEQQVRKL